MAAFFPAPDHDHGRCSADALAHAEAVCVKRGDFPKAEEGEFYAVDLLGFTVVDRQGRTKGVVEELEEAGAQDLLKLTGGTLVPLSMVVEVKDRLIVALDVDSLDEVRKLVGILARDVGMFKIGKQLFTCAGPQAVRLVQELGGERQ